MSTAEPANAVVSCRGAEGEKHAGAVLEASRYGVHHFNRLIM